MSGAGRRRDVGVWKYSYGTKPHVVFAMERRDRGGQVFVRFNNPDKPGVEKRDRKSLGLVVRDPRTGRLDQKLVRAAELAVQQFQAKLLVGHSPPRDDSEAPSKAAPSAAPPTASAATSLTIRAGFDLALDPERGKYGSNRTRRYDQMVKYRERLFGGRRQASPLLDRDLSWIAFVPAEARALWRRMADRHVASKGREFGVRAAEGVVDAISNDPRVDPRIRLAVELAAECRTGQVLRCTRWMLPLLESAPNDYESAPLGSLGQIEIAGAGEEARRGRSPHARAPACRRRRACRLPRQLRSGVDGGTG